VPRTKRSTRALVRLADSGSGCIFAAVIPVHEGLTAKPEPHRMRALIPLASVTILLAAACARKPDAYTLLRNETMGDTSRIVVATFDAEETEQFNRGNCEHARELFQVQPSNRSRFWCEKGRVRK
jgi:hypothetical protein